MYLTSSRYEEYTDTGKDNLPTVIGVRKETDETPFVAYITTSGDSFDRIANSLFSDPLRWWEIADINQHVPFPEELPPGMTLRVPSS